MLKFLRKSGADNIYIFGLKTQEVEARRSTYNPWDCYHASPAVRKVVDALTGKRFCATEPGSVSTHRRLPACSHGDFYFLLADFDSYLAAQERVSRDFQNPSLWAQKAILNVARSGKFTSDRTVAEYAREIWGIKPLHTSISESHRNHPVPQPCLDPAFLPRPCLPEKLRILVVEDDPYAAARIGLAA